MRYPRSTRSLVALHRSLCLFIEQFTLNAVRDWIEIFALVLQKRFENKKTNSKYK